MPKTTDSYKVPSFDFGDSFIIPPPALPVSPRHPSFLAGIETSPPALPREPGDSDIPEALIDTENVAGGEENDSESHYSGVSGTVHDPNTEDQGTEEDVEKRGSRQTASRGGSPSDMAMPAADEGNARARDLKLERTRELSGAQAVSSDTTYLTDDNPFRNGADDEVDSLHNTIPPEYETKPPQDDEVLLLNAEPARERSMSPIEEVVTTTTDRETEEQNQPRQLPETEAEEPNQRPSPEGRRRNLRDLRIDPRQPFFNSARFAERQHRFFQREQVGILQQYRPSISTERS